MGADDYVAKPYYPLELVARIRAVLRRRPQPAGGREPALLRRSGIELRPQQRRARCGDRDLDLTVSEFNILEALMRAGTDVVSKDELSLTVLGRTREPYDRSLDVHISNIRQKLAAAEAGGLPGLERFMSALPAGTRESLIVDPAASTSAGEDTRVLDARLPDGGMVTLVYALDTTPRRGYSFLDVLSRSIDNIVASMLGGVLFAAGLAWYLTRPIRRVRDGLGALASGALETRLTPDMGGQRDEFADLARDFDRMAERLQQLIGMRDQLLHDVSHELRSPLARLTPAIALQRQNKASAETSLARIEAEVRRLDELIGELLSLARSESGAQEKDRYFDLVGLVEAVAGNARFEAQPGAVEVRIMLRVGSSVIHGSPELMCRALENVLRNAIRVSKPGDSIAVTVQPAGAGSGIEVTIEDRGPGVPADKLEAMFAPFARIPGQGSGTGSGTGSGKVSGSGYGLGLAIAWRAVTAMNGTISARNAAPHGLAVVISLPVTTIGQEAE